MKEMPKRGLFLLLFAISFITLLAGNVPAAFSQSPEPMLKMVFIDAKSPGEIKKLARMAIDIAAVRKGPVMEDVRGISAQTYRVEAVVSAYDEKKLSRLGFSWSDAPVERPAIKISGAYEVYHSFDEPVHGINAQLYEIEDTYSDIAKLETIGYSIQERPLLAMRLTSQEDFENEGRCYRKPEVLYLATHHAREWVAPEMAMRLIKYLTSNYGSNKRVTNLLNTTEVWIIPVANPDGYEYTFTTERLWRKNLRDNDGDGEITIVDGVDPNRNFDSHWGYDDEGSSPDWPDQTFRGAEPNSEPETKAVVKFVKSHNFKFVLSYHTYSNLILYPWGWQVKIESFDDPIFVAQAGTDDNPAIWDSLLDAGYDPGLSADLYTANGDFVDWCYNNARIPAYTVELTFGEDADGNYYGFEFPDDEEMVQTVFEDNLEFALCCGESAAHPAHPVSPVGIKTHDIYHTPVTASYGSNQVIEILARKWRPLKLYYSINGGPEQRTFFFPKLGTFYNERPGVYYCKYRAFIRGQKAGDSLTYRIVARTDKLGPYSYDVVTASGNAILVVAAEDYSGTYPDYDPNDAPHYLQYYTDALDAAGYGYDVWDVDVHEAAPSYTEVLSHYDVAIWYTGDDYAPTVPGFEVHEEEVLNFRDFNNYDGGKLFATGQGLAWLSAVNGMFSDDFFQYNLGAYMHVEEGGMDHVSGLPFDVKGEDGDPIFDSLTFSIHAGDGANNQSSADTFLATSHFLPHFDNTIAARYIRPGGPFEPHSGNYYVYSQMADRAYKRLAGTFTLPEDSPTLTFWISYDIETDWDYAFVEISEAGMDNWTTLPDLNGLTVTTTGESCTSGWVERIHPFLAHYMDEECNPTGSTGSWNAFTGNSGGWQQVEMDLSAYAGKTIELYISYASDWGTQGLGIFVDDVKISGFAMEDFEAGMGEWSVSTAPGSGAFNNWERMSEAGFPEGPAIHTPDSVYLGFGFEAIDTAENRTAVMERVMRYLGQ